MCTPTRLARASGAGGAKLASRLHIVTGCLDGLSRARPAPAYVSIPSFRPSNPLFGHWPPCRSRLPTTRSQRSVPFPTPPPKKRGPGPFVRRRTTPSSNPGKGHLRVVGARRVPQPAPQIPACPPPPIPHRAEQPAPVRNLRPHKVVASGRVVIQPGRVQRPPQPVVPAPAQVGNDHMLMHLRVAVPTSRLQHPRSQQPVCRYRCRPGCRPVRGPVRGPVRRPGC